MIARSDLPALSTLISIIALTAALANMATSLGLF